MTDEYFEMAGPVEDDNGKLVLRIPMAMGGHEFAHVTEGISEVDGPYLKITLPQWLVNKLELKEGSRVAIDNKDRKFNMVRVYR
jgi:hypothetical protein